MTRKEWRDLSVAQRRGVVLAGIAELTLKGVALIDIRRRSAAEIRGSKRWWTVALFVNFIGPVAYFVLGRKR